MGQRPSVPALRTDVLRELARACEPHALRFDMTPDLFLPDMVFLRQDGSEVGRLRYVEPTGKPPHYRSLLPREASEAEERAFERYLAEPVFPVVQRRFGYDLWMSFVTGPDDGHPPSG